MPSIDQRVVQMNFDNKSFGKGVNQTVKDLGVLENKMQFKDAVKGFSQVEKAANGVTLSGIQTAMESVNNKFSAMGVVALTVLSNITTMAMNTGSKIAHALTLESVIAGYQEYETKLGSIQTILSNTQSKGGNITNVTSALDELNTYADMTIYNFAEMTRNIGTFTAAGVDLDTSVSAIKGIANLAAVSGSTSMQASTAMYQLSQALASGTIRLMDWNSVINAGMGGQVFQDALKETARAHGVSIDAIIEKQGSFRESLQDGWLSAEIMTDTLSKFTMTTSDYNKEVLLSQGYTEEQAIEIMKLGDTATDAATKVKSFTQLIDTTKEALGSGWGKSWELIIGDMEEAKTLWTGASQVLSKMVDDSSNARNGMLMVWKSFGGRDAIITGLSNVFSNLSTILDTVRTAFAEVFPPITGEQLAEVSKKFQELTDRFKMGEDSLKTLGSAFKTFFSVIKNVATLVGGTLSAGFKILQPILAIIGKVLGYAGVAFGSFTSAIDSGTPALELLLGAINRVSDKIVGFIENLANGLPSLESFSSAIDRAKEVLSGLASSTLDKASGGLSLIAKGFEKLSEWAQKAVSTVGDFVKNIDWNSVFLGGAAAGAAIGTGGIIAKIIGFLDGLKDAAKNASGFVESLSGPLDSLKGILEGYQQNLQAKTLINIAGAIGILAVSLVLLSQLDAGQLAGGVAALGAVMGELVSMVAILNKLNPGSMTATSASLLILSGALLIMASAMRVLANLSWDEIIRGTVALGALTGIMIGLTAAMNAIKSKAVGGAMSMIFIAAALMVLAQALKMLGSIPFEVMVQGIGVMAASLLILTVVLNTMKSAVGGAIAMVIVSGALIVLAQALSAFGSIPFNVLVQGIGVMATSLLILSVVLNIMKSAIGGAVAMLIITAALLALSGVLVILGSIDTNVIAQGLLTMVGVLGLFAGVSLILAQFAPQVLIVSAAFVVFSVGLMIASAAVIVMAIGLNMLLAAGLPALGMLALLAVALLPLIVISPLLLVAGAGMLALGVGLVVAGAGLLLFSTTSATAIPALFALSGAMLPLLAAAPMMAVVGAAMVVLGAGALVLGAGLVVLSMGFSMLNTSLPMGIEGLTRLAETAVQITPAVPLFIVLGAALVVLGAGALVGGEGLVVLGAGLIVTSAGIALFSSAVSGPFQAATEIFGKAMETFVWHTPGMLASGAALLVFGAGALLAGTGALIAGPGFLMMASGLQRFMSVWPGAEDAFNRFKTATAEIEPIVNTLTNVSNAMATLSTSILSFGASIASVSVGTTSLASTVSILIASLQTATTTATTASVQIVAATISMTSSIMISLNDLVSQFVRFSSMVRASLSATTIQISSSSSAISSTLTSLVSSTSNAVNQIGSHFARLGPSIAGGINSAIPMVEQAGRNVVQGCLNGMGSLVSAVYNRGVEVGRKAVEGVNAGAGNASPSKLTTLAGINIDQGAINGMKKHLWLVGRTGELVGVTAADSVARGFSSLDDSSFSVASLNPTVRPVMDLSAVQNESALRKTMENDGSSISVNADYVSGSVGTLANIISQNHQESKQTNQDLLVAINGLRDDMSRIANQEPPEFLLDIDGTRFAKATAKSINRELGVLARRGGLR